MTGRDLMPFGKYKGLELKDIPKDYSAWLCKQEGFADKNPTLYAFFTQGEAATTRPLEKKNIEVEKELLKPMSDDFKDFWKRAYGERLRRDGEVLYIAHLRVAIAAWGACSAAHAEMGPPTESDAVAGVNDDTPSDEELPPF